MPVNPRDGDPPSRMRGEGGRGIVFFSFFPELRAAKVPVSLREYLTLMEAMERRVAAFDIEEFYFLARTALVKDERHLDRFDRVFGHCFKGIETLGRSQDRNPRGVAEKARRAASDRGGEKADRGARRLGKADGDVAPAARRAEGAAPGRQQMDRHRRHLAVRRLRLQPRRRAHRPGGGRQPQRGQGVGPARVPQSRRHASSSAPATSSWRCAGCASSPARGRPRSSTSPARSARPRTTPAGST